MLDVNLKHSKASSQEITLNRFIITSCEKSKILKPNGMQFEYGEFSSLMFLDKAIYGLIFFLPWKKMQSSFIFEEKDFLQTGEVMPVNKYTCCINTRMKHMRCHR